ncbi:hypothetical protein F5Y04DRAFT_291990 [Hypomontagnella monticulosa]|nr:hypothetical protein F5Y04DRAFT_291990 [Hypomontagnella monticulosa]
MSNVLPTSTAPAGSDMVAMSSADSPQTYMSMPESSPTIAPDLADTVFTTAVQGGLTRSQSSPAIMTHLSAYATEAIMVSTMAGIAAAAGTQDQQPSDSVASASASQQHVPGCTHGENDSQGTKLKFTNSMMQAYVAMRGPTMEGSGDPLFEWIRTREVRTGKDRASRLQDDRKDILKMLELIDKAIDSEATSGSTPRDGVFEMTKPPHHHHVKAQHPANAEGPVAQEKHFSWSDDDDDEEGGGPSGRISPCTFLAWAQGSKRWGRHSSIKDPQGVLSNASRIRPTHPTTSKVRLDPQYVQNHLPQIDQETGEELTPEYDVPLNPSIIYTPPGTVPHFWSSAFQERYNRMVPLIAQKHRNVLYGKVGGSVTPAGTNERYTKSQVDKVAKQEQYYHVASLPGPQALGLLDVQHSVVANQKGEINYIGNTATLQLRRIIAVQHRRGLLYQRYNMFIHGPRTTRTQKMSNIEDRIKEHIVNQFIENQSEIDRLFAIRAELYAKYLENLQIIATLEQGLKEDCLQLGFKSFEELCEEIVAMGGAHILDPAHLPENIRRDDAMYNSMNNTTNFPTNFPMNLPMNLPTELPTMNLGNPVNMEAGPSKKSEPQPQQPQQSQQHTSSMDSTHKQEQQRKKEESSEEEYVGKGKGISRRRGRVSLKPTVTFADEDDGHN